VITMDIFHKIRALDHLGESKSKIARELDLDRKTVRKYLKSTAPPCYRPRSTPSRQDFFAEFEGFVRGKLVIAPELSAGEIYALIRPLGYLGSERTIQRRMKSWCEGKPKERFFEQEYTPGEQAQFDFKESIELPFLSGPVIAHLHFGTLPFSNACVIKGFPHKTYECFMDGVHSFFEKIGGQTKNIRIDNLSPCVKRVKKDGGRDYTDAFNRAIKYYDFGVLPCSPGRGNEKGDVERDIQTWSRRFRNHVNVHGIRFRDFSHLNVELEAFGEQEQSEAVTELLKTECGQLRSLLPRDEDVLCRVEETRASPHGTVRVAKTTYSVADAWIGLECRVVAGAFETRITRKGSDVIVVHPRMSEGEHSIKLEHILKSLLRKPQAMIRWKHREILFPEKIFRDLYRRLKSQENHPGASEREFLRIMNLIHHTPLSEIQCALEIVLGQPVGVMNIFMEVKDLLLVERRPEALVIDLSTRFGQTPISPNLKDYDQLIPNQQGVTG
jgi:transposase